MKKLWIVVIAGAIILWVVSWFRTPEAVATSGAQSWPGGLGTLGSVQARYPPIRANAASARLMALAKALPRSDGLDLFVWREMMRGTQEIGEAPPLPDVSAIHDLLLHEPIVWERRHEEVGDERTTAMRAVHLTTARTLVAHALKRARANDPAAWEELHAVWNLARSLDGHPQVMLQTAALSMARMINAVAWKLPLPAPAWFGELQSRDEVAPLVEAFQAQAASYWADGSQIFPTKFLANSVEHDRRIAEQVLKTTDCAATIRANELGTDLEFVWRRAFRYRAEREATANAIRIRQGQPIESKSRCTDGNWTFDGATLRFSRAIETTAPDKPMPLVLKIQP